MRTPGRACGFGDPESEPDLPMVRETRPTRAAVALSGGVDSSVAAYLLKRQGYDVVGVCLDLFTGSTAPAAAVETGKALDIPVLVLDRRHLFRRSVLRPFCHAYLTGRTPNPCVLCNPEVKFAAVLDAAAEMDAAYAAFGHYARVVRDGDSGLYRLLRGIDLRKDQSYFLHRLGQAHLQKTIFPLGELTKQDVRRLAERIGLPAAARKDSADLCFIPHGKYTDYLRKALNEAATMGDAEGGMAKTGKAAEGATNSLDACLLASLTPGDIVDAQGSRLGRHKGLFAYTVGQRKKLGIPQQTPMAVVALDPAKNQVVAGPESALYAHEVKTCANTFINGKAPEGPLRVGVKLRSTAAVAEAVYHPLAEREALLVFRTAQRAAAPGQSAVYYHSDRGEEVLGGGYIVKQSAVPASAES